MRFQLAHALKREVEILKVADRRLAAVDSKADLSLGDSQSHSPIFKPSGKVYQLFGEVSTWTRAGTSKMLLRTRMLPGMMVTVVMRSRMI